MTKTRIEISMDRSFLVKIFGFPATLIHGEPMVMDRWRWLDKHLSGQNANAKLLDIGCGNGAFTIGLALKGYECLGLSWDEKNKAEAYRRAKICKAPRAKFETEDIRLLDKKEKLFGNFDVIICLETIEHILDDQKLMRDMSRCLKPGGKLLLTTPNYDYIPIGIGDEKKAAESGAETGGHVRIGYTERDLQELCKKAKLSIDQISYCSGFLSQKITAIMRFLCRIHPLIGWLAILPLRPLPLMFDRLITKILRRPEYSICLIAHKIDNQERYG